MVLVSACLLGVRCRYDGCDRRNEKLIAELKEVSALPVCPEELGGLSTPRPPAQFVGGDGRQVLAGRARLVNAEGDDVTEQYLRGAREAVALAERLDIDEAYLKDFSPACGLTEVSSGGRRVEGIGVCAAALAEAGLTLHAVR